ncbi:MAG: UDP-N-acetylglucosamine 1-carboxyvinyltransferase [Deltaproteobacteria bacterium]|nr:UDP-N-acetylglucosamine 1-carboxyvinyltransferase [Candidatus Zymogenaceae bacterium]
MIIKGSKPLAGEITVSGSKNAALPILIASIMAPGRFEFHDVPDLMDIHTTAGLLRELGAEVDHQKTFVVDSTPINNYEASWDLVRKMRASFLIMGALISRFRRARVSLPGGCELGLRPVDQHLKGLQCLGVKISEEHGLVIADAAALRGGKVVFDFPTVGATENLLMAAATAKGETVIQNAAQEPEVVDLARALTAMGAKIEGAGKETIRIQGVESLRPITHTIIPDRIEAGTFMVAAAITGGSIIMKNTPTAMLVSVMEKLAESGVSFQETADGIKVVGPEKIRPVDIKTLPYPGFPTDLQAPMTSLLTIAEGTSIISETIFEKRFAHVAELIRLGADITIDGRSAVIKGTGGLLGAPVMSSDLRNSAALIIAGLAAHGTTEVYRIYHLDRGYERMEAKLALLGADIRRAPQDD